MVEIIRPYIFDADLEVPVKINNYTINCLLNDDEMKYYQDFKYSYLEGKFEIGFLEVTQKFQSYYSCCGNKLKMLSETVLNILNRGEKVAIYVKFLKEVYVIKAMFDSVEFTGRSRNKEAIKEFKNQKYVMICTYGVGSFGLNLQFCNNLIFFSQTFDFGHKEQALHRFYRTGQKKDVNVYDMWINNVNLDNLFKLSLDKKEQSSSHIKRLVSREEALNL